MKTTKNEHFIENAEIIVAFGVFTMFIILIIKAL